VTSPFEGGSSTPPPGGDERRARSRFPSTPDGQLRKEIFRILDTADYLQDRIDQKSRQADLALGAVALLGAMGGLFATATNRAEFQQVTILVGAYLTVVLAAASFIRKRSVHAIRRDKRALAEIVGLIRETRTAGAFQEAFSTLEDAELRIRLSRFDIGPPED
jgi:hypothetical protein